MVCEPYKGLWRDCAFASAGTTQPIDPAPVYLAINIGILAFLLLLAIAFGWYITHLTRT